MSLASGCHFSCIWNVNSLTVKAIPITRSNVPYFPCVFSCSVYLIFPFLYPPSFKKYYQIISPFPLSHLFPPPSPLAFPFPIFFLDPYNQCQQSLMCYSATWTANQVPGDQPTPLACHLNLPCLLSSVYPSMSQSRAYKCLCGSASWRLKHGK